MKASRLHGSGGPEQISYENALMPELRPGDALIRVHATGITPAELTWAETYKHCDGSERLPAIPGHEVSGVVEAMADAAANLLVGDEVYGLTAFCRDGGAAHYVAVAPGGLALKPKTLGHTQEAAVQRSTLTAWQTFLDHARLGRGQWAWLGQGGGAQPSGGSTRPLPRPNNLQ
jgi:NADPH:quinone reductase-like Zn-dependent oxidoreductase